jgi:hypothetical protein
MAAAFTGSKQRDSIFALQKNNEYYALPGGGYNSINGLRVIAHVACAVVVGFNTWPLHSIDLTL